MIDRFVRKFARTLEEVNQSEAVMSIKAISMRVTQFLLSLISRLSGSRIKDFRELDRTVKINNVMTTIGMFTYGYENISILSWECNKLPMLRIGRFCSISANLKVFIGGNHRFDWTSTYPYGHCLPTSKYFKPFSGHPAAAKPVIIGHDVWIGRDVTIMQGVKIGNGSIIAANSHVVKDVEEYTIIGGNPAQKIRDRFDKDIIRELTSIEWWNWDKEKILENVHLLCSEPEGLIKKFSKR